PPSLPTRRSSDLGLGRLLRTHGQDGDLGVGARRALRLGDLQAFLDGVLVKLVDEPVHRRAVQRAVRVLELTFGPGIWHLLDQHDDVHRLHRPPCSLAYSLPNRNATAGTGSTSAMLLVSSLYGVILMATRSRPFHSLATCRPSCPRRLAP